MDDACVTLWSLHGSGKDTVVRFGCGWVVGDEVPRGSYHARTIGKNFFSFKHAHILSSPQKASGRGSGSCRDPSPPNLAIGQILLNWQCKMSVIAYFSWQHFHIHQASYNLHFCEGNVSFSVSHIFNFSFYYHCFLIYMLMLIFF